MRICLINGINFDWHLQVWNLVVRLMKTKKFFFLSFFFLTAITRRDFLFKDCCVWIISSLAPFGRTNWGSGGREGATWGEKWDEVNRGLVEVLAWTRRREWSKKGGKTVSKVTEQAGHLPLCCRPQRFHPSPCLRLSGNMERDYRGEAGLCSHFSNKKA